MGEEDPAQSSMDVRPDKPLKGMVARGGIEPPTRGFSGLDEGNLSQPEKT